MNGIECEHGKSEYLGSPIYKPVLEIKCGVNSTHKRLLVHKVIV